MKRFISLFLALIMVFALSACADKTKEGTAASNDTEKESSETNDVTADDSGVKFTQIEKGIALDTDASNDTEKESSETNDVTADDSGVKFTQIDKGIALDTEGRIWSFSLVDDLKVLCDSAKFTYISEGNGLKCALDENGGLWTWGANKSGQLGDGTTTDRDIPEKVLDGVKMVAAYGYNAFAIKNDGTLYQWGYGNCPAKLRENVDDRDNILIPTLVEIDAKFEYIATGNNYASVAVDSNGTRYAWGVPCTIMGYSANQIDPTLDDDAPVTPFTLKAISNDTAPNGTYYFGGNTTYVIDANNTLYISGGKDSRLDPFEESGSFKVFTKVTDKVSMIVPAMYGTLYIDTDGNIWGWGSDAFKICAPTTSPVQITNGTKYTDVAVLDAGSTMAYAIGADGNIYTFGEKDSTPRIVETK